MCGIFGLVSYGHTTLDVAQIKAATDSLIHRGPDDSGIWLSENRKIAFGHRRLAIIDLHPRSQQPFHSADNTSTLTFNGEIYNYQELKKQFSNFSWKTSSDTELLAELLNQKGENCLNELDGMFAFAQIKNNKIILAVDPAGKKPLYTYWDGQHFAFASEIKSFFKISFLKKEINPDVLCLYLAYGYIPQPLSFYKYIQKIPGGHFLKVDTQHGPEGVKKYWDLPKGQRLQLSYPDAQIRVQELIANSVKKRMLSDVPIGTFLSGGIDSSIVSYHASQSIQTPLNTFCVSYEKDPLANDYNESFFAKKMAKKINSHHREIEISSAALNENILTHFDEPYADSSCFPTYQLCQQTKQYVSVALSGDGGDELFGGYLRFQASLASEQYRKLSQLLLFPFPKKVSSRQGLFAYIARYKNALNHDLLGRLTLWNAFFDEDDWKRYISRNTDVLFHERQQWQSELAGLEVGEKILHYNFKTYLFNDLLPKIDRMSMLCALEVRSPFLDKQLIEFAFQLPTEYKFNLFQGKKLLKDSYRPLLGKEIVDRKKKGFGFPLEGFFSQESTHISLDNVHRHFQHIPTQIKDLKGRNLVSKYFALYDLEKILQGSRHA